MLYCVYEIRRPHKRKIRDKYKEEYIMEYHVSKRGSDGNNGTQEKPFLTISKAAELAEENDRIIVHEGVYRECVSPANGARTAQGRIIYEAAENENVVIKGSERIKDWKREENGVWRTVIDNAFYGKYNPYKEIIWGDWLFEPTDRVLHTGQVYINGKALREVTDSAECASKSMTWCCETDETKTVIRANFADADPNAGLAEINVRRACFAPVHTGVNYITVRGFEMEHAASEWAPPTAEQTGMLCTNWSKGWIIENNILHDAKCSAVSVGKERSTGHNLHTRYHRKSGYQHQLETVFAALHIGWSRERIGGHVIRNNTIYDCGQNGIVGHMGGAFSEIYGNHIYNIGNKREFFGAEIAGIKLHADIDTYIHNNNIHDCVWGTWLDWQAQGVRLSSNLYFNNDNDIWIEVTHGPHIVDNNIFASRLNFRNAAQGGAYIHNLFCGAQLRYDVLDRSTPYHLSHSTEVKGTAVVYGGDDRYFNNIFVGGEPDEGWKCGTELYNGFTSSMEEYIEKTSVYLSDPDKVSGVRQPVYINNNSYLAGAKGFEKEKNKIESDYDPKIRVSEENGSFYLEIDIPEYGLVTDAQQVRTHNLPIPRITEAPYEKPDGTELVIDRDYFGICRAGSPTAGPFEGIEPGKHRLLVWQR